MTGLSDEEKLFIVENLERMSIGQITKKLKRSRVMVISFIRKNESKIK